jgi:hypothetical protein
LESIDFFPGALKLKLYHSSTFEYPKLTILPMDGIDEEAEKPNDAVEKVIHGDKPEITGHFAIVNNGFIDKNNAEDTDAADEKEEGYGCQREPF